MAISTLNGKVIEKKFLTEDVILLSLLVPKDFSFQAGQFITMFLEKDSVKKPRSYSILNQPSQKGRLDFVIKLLEQGFASEIFREMEIGEEIEMKGPFGHFLFHPEGSEEHLFIGTGTGLAPLYSMIKENVKKYPDKRFQLLLGMRYQKDIFMEEELKKLAKENKNFNYVITLSREEWNGPRGRVQKHLPKNLKDKTFYICGLKELVLETKELLLSKKVEADKVNFERYN